MIVQDPVWEQSFPPIDGVTVALADARGAGARPVRLQPAEVEERRAHNEERLRTLRADFLRLGLDPVLVDDAGPAAVHATMLHWANARFAGRGTL